MAHNFCSQDICRACLKEFEISKFGLLDIRNLQKMFYACTSMEIVENDVYTKFLCEICYETIEKFYKFREMCIDSYNKLSKAHDEQKTNDICAKKNEKLEDYLSEDITNSIKEELLDLKDNDEVDDDLDSTAELSNNFKEEVSQTEDELDHTKSSSNLSETEEKPKRNNINTNPNSTKSQKMLNCEFCTKKFFKESRLNAHIRTHEGLKPYPCSDCDKQFNKKHGLAVHYEVAHSNSNKLYRCSEPDCDKAYRTKRVLDGHIRSVHVLKGRKTPTSCICEACGKVLANKSILRKHSYTHTGELPYKCDKCPKRYTTRHKLKEHYMRHNGIKNFVCPYCGLKKTTRDELKIHINYHTKEKVHQCSHCSSSFLNSGNLNRHIKIVHQGIRAYSCAYCDKSFGKAETLKHHTMTHTGEKPHECKSCGKRFIQVIALQMHIKRNAKCKLNQDA